MNFIVSLYGESYLLNKDNRNLVIRYYCHNKRIPNISKQIFWVQWAQSSTNSVMSTSNLSWGVVSYWSDETWFQILNGPDFIYKSLNIYILANCIFPSRRDKNGFKNIYINVLLDKCSPAPLELQNSGGPRHHQMGDAYDIFAIELWYKYVCSTYFFLIIIKS